MTWRVANDTPISLKPRRTRYFLIDQERKPLREMTGRLRTWRTYEGARWKADKLNGGESDG